MFAHVLHVHAICQICETLIVDRIDESKAVIDCVERLITTLCKQPSKGEHSAVKSVDPSTSPLASLIGCLPKSAAARQNMRESLVCPAPYRHFDLPYDTLFRILGPDLIVIFINAILCEVKDICALVVCHIEELFLAMPVCRIKHSFFIAADVPLNILYLCVGECYLYLEVTASHSRCSGVCSILNGSVRVARSVHSTVAGAHA